jgi:HK97 family phage major capsid protein/HK97 family phage prohead protease
MKTELMTRDAREGTAPKVAERLQALSKEKHHREATVGAIDIEARTVDLSFSSELEYERWWGVEILGHAAGEVRLARLQDKAAVLWNHDWDDQRGVVESARIDGDNKGRAVVRFSKSDDGEHLFQDIVDGIVTKVSVGYAIHGIKLVEEREGMDVYRVTDWEPFEISMVSVPADATVGVGRGAEKPHEEQAEKTADNSASINNSTAQQTLTRTENTMDKILRDAQGNLVRAKVDDNGKIVEVLEMIERAGEAAAAATTRGAEAERNRVTAIGNMGREYKNETLAMQFITDGKSAEDFQRALLADFATERSKAPLADQNGGAGIGMSETDVRKYSLMKVVRALANPQDAAAQKAAAFEIECSIAAQRQYGKEAKGILIPADVLGSRAFNAGGAANTPAGSTSGANTVATELASGSFIEMLRNRTTIMRLGTTMAGLVGNVDIPKQTGGATAYWLGEGADATEGVPTVGQIALTPKTVAAYTDITRRLAMQSTPDAEGIVVRDLRNAMSQAIDYAGYYGTGADNQPKGIKNYTGINAKDFAAANPTFAELVEMESLIAADNADVNSMAYVMNALMRGHCKTTPKFGSGTESTIWEPGNSVNGYRTEVTNQVATGDVFFGNYADLIIALWGGLDLTVDPYSLSKSGGLRLVVFQDVDFVLRRVESICWGSAAVA